MDTQASGGTEGPGAERREAPPASGLPCLSSNNSDKKTVQASGNTTPELPKFNVLTGGHKRSAFVLAEEIMALAKEFGLERLGFFTLTFSDRVQKLKEANRRFNNLNRRVLKARYKRAIVVTERQQSGRVHFHLLVVLAADIRSGLDFAAIARGDYRTANAELRGEWAFWRKTAPLYGFGRHELLPVKSNGEGIARYVGKYISKNVRQRSPADKGARLVRYIGFKPGDRKANTRLAWNNDHAQIWRHKLKAWAERNGMKDMEDIKKIFGPRWAYFLQGVILLENIVATYVFPSQKAGMRDSEDRFMHEMMLDKAMRENAARGTARFYELKQ